MKKLKVVNQDACMACLQCEVACSEAFYKEFDPDKSCIHIIEKNEKTKTQVCVQCGKCVAACPFGVMVAGEKNPSKCIACGICVKACPMDVLEIVESYF